MPIIACCHFQKAGYSRKADVLRVRCSGSSPAAARKTEPRNDRPAGAEGVERRRIRERACEYTPFNRKYDGVMFGNPLRGKSWFTVFTRLWEVDVDAYSNTWQSLHSQVFFPHCALVPTLVRCIWPHPLPQLLEDSASVTGLFTPGLGLPWEGGGGGSAAISKTTRPILKTHTAFDSSSRY